MKLSTLLDGVKVKAIKDGRGNHMDIDGSPIDIGGLSIDSRRVRAGDLFFALKGGRADGKAFIADAIGRGAAAVLADSPGGMDEVKAGAPAFI
ncbi:MAG: Mur ligase domain-containing protein, partial [Nitrospiraceae bacterium]|nr:Mur ligase domain-containing protein [Nitrospiraceae bacterium]